MDKMKMHSPDLSQDNIAKIRALFPDCVTEAADEHGNIRLAIDFDQLRQTLSDHIVEGPQERYRLDWPGKREALLTANAPIAKTLRPCREESVDFDTTQNLFIEGDNLDALKLLQESYLGKVKMIYIDPPYNTGNDFIYEDDFAESASDFLKRSNQVGEGGARLVANGQSNGRFHSDWLSMMYSRLKLAHRLLKSDGVIFISIDDNEAQNLMKICSEIFGGENFIAQLAVQLNPRGRHLDRFVAKTHESILVIVKDAMELSSISGVEKEGRMVEEYNRSDDKGAYRLLGLRNRNQAFNPVTRPKLYYPLYVSPRDGSVSLTQSDVYCDPVFPDAPDGVKTCWTWGKEKVAKEADRLLAEKTGSEWRIYRKDYLLNEDGETARTLIKSVWTDKEITNDYGRASVKSLFGSSVMDFPKSVGLITRLVAIGSSGNDIVLDFFSGSATTAHAVMEQNGTDGGNRKFVMVQIPEVADEKSDGFKAGYRVITEISKERIRRAGMKIVQGECHMGWNRDVGFRVFKVDSSNMSDVYYRPDEVHQDELFGQVDSVKPDRTGEDLLFQVLLDWGVELTLPINRETLYGKTVYSVDGNALIACFATGVTDELVKEIAARAPLRAVFRDTSFVRDADRINAEQLFRQLSPGTELKAI